MNISPKLKVSNKLLIPINFNTRFSSHLIFSRYMAQSVQFDSVQIVFLTDQNISHFLLNGISLHILVTNYL